MSQKKSDKSITPPAQPAVSIPDDAALSDPPVPPAIQRRVEQFFAMQMSGGRDPFVDKMDGAHITTVLQNAAAADERHHATTRMLFVLGIVAVIGICWLFLAYQKSEHLDAVIGAIVGLAGGYGLGRSSSKD